MARTYAVWASIASTSRKSKVSLVTVSFCHVVPPSAVLNTVDPALSPVESYEGGRVCFAGGITLDRSGAFGYTVRVVPQEEHLASVAELGLVATA